MFVYLRKLISLFSKKDRKKIFFLSVMIIIGSIFEILSIGLIVPFMYFVLDPSVILNNSFLGPLLIKFNVDKHIHDQEKIVIGASLIFFSFYTFKNVYLYFMWKILHKFVHNNSVLFSNKLLKYYLGRSYLFHVKENTSNLIRNLTEEVDRVLVGVVVPLIYLISEFFVTIGLLSLILFKEPYISILAISIFLINGLIIIKSLKNRLRKLGKDRMYYHGKVIKWISQSLESIKEIKLFGKENYFLDSFTYNNNKLSETNYRFTLAQHYPRLIIESTALFLFLFLFCVFIFAGKDIKTILPTFSLFGLCIIRLLPAVNRVINSANRFRFNYRSVNLLYDTFNEIGQFQDNTKVEKKGANLDQYNFSLFTNIQLKNIYYFYNKEKSILKGLNLTINKGDYIAIVGSSGAGKTTLVNILLGLLEPDSGEILIDNIDITKDLSQYRSNIGYVPQEIYLLDDTIRNNVAFGLNENEISNVEVWRALREAQLIEFVQNLDHKLDTVIGERGYLISGGERQRLGIARALYNNPGILIFDEATSSLDIETEKELLYSINNLSNNRIIITVTHRIHSILDCDKIYVLDKGKLTEPVTFEELMSHSNKFKQLTQ